MTRLRETSGRQPITAQAHRRFDCRDKTMIFIIRTDQSARSTTTFSHNKPSRIKWLNHLNHSVLFGLKQPHCPLVAVHATNQIKSLFKLVLMVVRLSTNGQKDSIVTESGSKWHHHDEKTALLLLLLLHLPHLLHPSKALFVNGGMEGNGSTDPC